MMQVEPTRPYRAKLDGRSLIRMPDGKSVFKVYYLSLVGRDNPDRYEWEGNRFTTANFEDSFSSGDFQGIGFVTAFPHVTKIFRYSPWNETVLDVREIDTRFGTDLNMARPDGSHEFACYAEVVIAALESAAWAQAATVEAYLAFYCKATDFEVQSHTKLAEYWEHENR